jgi:hypothetical protein
VELPFLTRTKQLGISLHFHLTLRMEKGRPFAKSHSTSCRDGEKWQPFSEDGISRQTRNRSQEVVRKRWHEKTDDTKLHQEIGANTRE